MAYAVNITPRAEADFIDLFYQVNARESDAALRWYRGLKEAVLTLRDHPERCPVTPEKRQLRHLLYGNKPDVYRVIFRVMERQKRVDILHIRHGARMRFTASDIG
jgi:plasmid stabilization system protein ParE